MTAPAADRRLINRVHAVWKKAAGTGHPRRSQIDPRDYGSDWANCLLIDLDPVHARSRFSHVGDNLRDPTWPTFDRQSVAECLEGSLLGLVTKHIPRLVVKKKALSFGGSAVHNEGDILYRTILLPLGESHEQMDGILAAVGYRDVSVAQEIPLAEGLRGDAATRHAAGLNGQARAG